MSAVVSAAIPDTVPQSADVPLIALTHLRKTYSTGEVLVEALRDVSLEIRLGEFVAIMGASGSGKSTLMHILGCLDRPTSGSYRFAGTDVATLDHDALAALRREQFGFVFQSYNLIRNASATENVEVPAIYAGMPRHERHQRANQLLTTLGLGSRLSHRPGELSGGQQQRVSIARALMNGGSVILADEPTGALDSQSGAEVMNLLYDLARHGHTIILITHDREVANHAERIIELKDGAVIGDARNPQPAAALATAAAAPLIPERPVAGRSISAVTESTEAFKLALRALRANLFRTILTLLGIVIGVASVIAMLAVGEGAKRDVLAQVGRMGSNLLMVRAGTPNQRGPGAGTTTLMPADADALAELPNVVASVPEQNGSVTARLGNVDVQTQVTATSPKYPETRDWPVAEGIFFTDEDQRGYATVAVLGTTVVKNLFTDGSDPIGQFVVLNNVPFLVIGVMTSKGASMFGGDSDDVIFVPVTTGGLRLFGQRYVRSITVAVKDVSEIDATLDAATDLLRNRHGREDFQIRNMVAMVQMLTSTQNTLTWLLGSIAAISLLVGGIGVMNIMLVSVTERTREIGIRMATGARTRDILQQFLTEATVVCAVGGVLGVVVGLAIGALLGKLASMPVAFTAAPAAMAFGCAVATGVIFGFAPAVKAAHLDPVVALSGE
jgi:macrolide transport system ATP-binding/permease protein